MVYLSLGTNIGDKRRNLECAIEMIRQQIGDVVSQSAFLCTEPWGFESQNVFLNACVGVETALTPTQLLNRCQKIERKMGRTHKSTIEKGDDGKMKTVYHDRIIDIDILLYDNRKVHTSRLTIPHPLMSQRRFVLEPLSEIAYNVKIPGTKMSVGEMLSTLPADS